MSTVSNDNQTCRQCSECDGNHHWLVACGDDGTGAEDIVAGNWVSAENYTGTDGTSGNLRVSIDPVTDPAELSGSWSLATLTGHITDGGLSGSQVSVTLSLTGGGSVLLTGTLSAGAINGTLNGSFSTFGGPTLFAFNATSVTLHRGS